MPFFIRFSLRVSWHLNEVFIPKLSPFAPSSQTKNDSKDVGDTIKNADETTGSRVNIFQV